METTSKLLVVDDRAHDSDSVSQPPHDMVRDTRRDIFRCITGRVITAFTLGISTIFTLLFREYALSRLFDINSTEQHLDVAKKPFRTVEWGPCQKAALPEAQCGYVV